MRSHVMLMNQVSRSNVKVTRAHWKSLSACKMDFNINWHKCSPVWCRVSHTKFRSLRPRWRSHIEVKVQINIWRCVKGPLSHHLLSDCNKMVIIMTTAVTVYYARSRSLKMMKYPDFVWSISPTCMEEFYLEMSCNKS